MALSYKREPIFNITPQESHILALFLFLSELSHASVCENFCENFYFMLGELPKYLNLYEQESKHESALCHFVLQL